MAHFQDSMESLVEEMSQSHVHFEKADTIFSGESKFKNYTFEPHPARNMQDTKRCVDFWKFIENRPDLFPQRGYKVQTSDVKTQHTQKEVELTWANILELLKQKKMDKVANQGPVAKDPCKVESCYEEAVRKEKERRKRGTLQGSFSDDSLDDFKLDNLNDYDPQKVTYAEVAVQTDPIETADKETQTDFPDSAMELRNRLKGLDDMLKEVADADLTGYFDCICDDPCAWLPYPTGTASNSSSNDSQRHKRKQHRCTCSCGEMNCLCSLCAAILANIQAARDSFEQLSAFEIEECPCAKLSCACLADYRTLLDTKLEINLAVRKAANDPNAKFGLPMRCECSCHQANCPCRIVMRLMAEMDELMGYKEKPLLFFDKGVDATFGVDVCRCDGEDTDYDEHCACLSFYRRRILEKIEMGKLLNSSPALSTSASNEYDLSRGCSGECMDECTLQTCNKTITLGIAGSGCSKSVSDSDVACLCENRDCLSTIMSRDSSVLIGVKNYSDLPGTPPNSSASLL